MYILTRSLRFFINNSKSVFENDLGVYDYISAQDKTNRSGQRYFDKYVSITTG